MNIRNPFAVGGEPTPLPRYTKEYDQTIMAWVLSENGRPFAYVFSQVAADGIILALNFRRNALSILPTLFVSSNKLWSN